VSGDKVKYEGQWKNGLKHGFGKLAVKEGSTYEGEWKDGIKEGFGKMRWHSNNYYEGEFRNNKINGSGYMIWFDSFEKYVGQWADCLQNGKGIQIWYESKGEFKYLRNRYIGEFKNGFRHGYGVFLYSNGSKFEGMWENNSKNGFGIYTKEDGNQVVGFYKYDRFVEYAQPLIQNPSQSRIERKKPTIRPITPSNQEERDKIIKEVNSSQNSIITVRQPTTSQIIVQQSMDKKSLGALDIIMEKDEHNATSNKKEIKDNLTSDNKSIVSNNYNMTGEVSNNGGKNNITQKVTRESEMNHYRTLLDISDLIESEPDLDSSIREIENTLLRYNSEIRIWYKMYANKEFLKETNKTNDDHSQSSKLESNKGIMFTEEKEKKVSQTSPPQVISESIYNNDLGFAMEMKELWRFIRDCNLTSVDFTLAQFNRIFYRGPRNYIEMFMLPEELDQKFIYEYIYKMIQKSKDEFCLKYRDKLKDQQGEPYSPNTFYKVDDIDIVFDLHNKRQVILLRQFAEALIRIAYLKYYYLDIPLHAKLKELIENCIKSNMLFKRIYKKDKSQVFTESSVNSSVVLDIKVKNVDADLDSFINKYEFEIKSIFKEIYMKSTCNPKRNDMTITYRYFYDSIIKRIPQFNSFLEKSKFIELINAFHKNKKLISDVNKNSKETFAYIEALMDSEMILYEFSEVIFFISRKYFQNSENKNNYFEIFKIFDDQIKRLDYVFEAKEKYFYYFPKLKNHIIYEGILEAKRLKEEEERKKAVEVKRYNMERRLLQLEDANIVPDVKEASEEEEEDEDDDDDY
jgi:hypothetical protein